MGSFTNYVLSKAHGIYSFDCNMYNSLQPPQFLVMELTRSSSLDGCESLDWNSCRAGSSMNPEYYWILESIKNFRDWVYVVITAVDRAQTDFASQTATLVTDFVNTDLGDVCARLFHSTQGSHTLIFGRTILGSLPWLLVSWV